MDKQTEKELNELYEEALGSLAPMASHADDVHPYAITSLEDGPGQLLGVDPSMESDEAVSSLYAGIKQIQSEGNLVGFAVVTDVTITHPESGATLDAIYLLFEHRSGFATSVVVPYELSESGRQFAEPKRLPTQPQVFTGT